MSDIDEILYPSGESKLDLDENTKNMVAEEVSEEYRNYIADLIEVTGTPAGRRLLSSIIIKLGTFEPAYCGNAQIHKRTALKDFGCELLDDLAVAAPEAHDKMHYDIRRARKLDELLRRN